MVERVNARLKDEFGAPLAGAWTPKSPSALDVRCCCTLCKSDNAVVDRQRLARMADIRI